MASGCGRPCDRATAWRGQAAVRPGLSLRAVADALLERTGYASAHSAEVALRLQFKRRGWPLRTRAQAQMARSARGGDLPRAA